MVTATLRAPSLPAFTTARQEGHVLDGPWTLLSLVSLKGFSALISFGNQDFSHLPDYTPTSRNGPLCFLALMIRYH